MPILSCCMKGRLRGPHPLLRSGPSDFSHLFWTFDRQLSEAVPGPCAEIG